MSDDAAGALRGLRDALRTEGTITDADDFVFRLSEVLSLLGVDPGGRKVSLVMETTTTPETLKALRRHLPGVQQALVAASPTFLPALDPHGRAVLTAFFAPPPTNLAGPAVALSSYLSLTAMLAPNPPAPLPSEAREFLLTTLAIVVGTYGIDRLYTAVFGGEDKEGVRTLAWEDALRAAASMPAKVANAVGRWKDEGWSGDVPDPLVPRAYFDSLSAKLEGLMYEIARTDKGAEMKEAQAALRAVIEKLAGIGLLAPPPEPSRQPALLPSFLPRALEHLHPPAIAQPYPLSFFPAVFLPLPASALSALAGALLTHLPYHLAPPALLPNVPDERIRRASTVLGEFLGPPAVADDAWNAILQPLFKKNAGTVDDSVQQAARRMVVTWIGTGGTGPAAALVDATLEAWSDPKHIRFGLYAQQFNLTNILLLAISLLPPMSPHIVAVSRRGRFIQAIQAYLSHPDAKIRRLGMLVAEVMSDRTIEESDTSGPTQEEEMEELKAGLEIDEETGNPTRAKPRAPRGARGLRFTGMWEGTGEGREESRWLRSCVGVLDGNVPLSDNAAGWMLGWHITDIQAKPTEPVAQPTKQESPRGRKTETRPKPRPKIVMLDDDQVADPLQGYTDDSPSSSRSASPTREFLDEVAADPSLAVDATKKRKLKRPVYVRQLAELLRDKDKPDSIEMALQWGEGLVRAKRSFGTEVSENAVAVAAAAIALANPFHLDDFEQRRQGLVTALVAMSPRNVPPFLAELYFSTTYSLHQKSVMLTALAMGARELAGLPVPEPRTNRRIDFPTKTLPPALHAKYVTPQDTPFAGQLEDAVDGMRSLLLSKGAEMAQQVPEIAREQRLRVGVSKRRKVGDTAVALDSADAGPAKVTPPVVPYTAVAAEYFILPLVNRFWEFFQDSSVRESRAVSLGGRYRGAGTGMVLSPLALDKFLVTLALLTHAARHAPTFLGVLAPAVLELAVTVGARHPSQPSHTGEEDQSGERDAQVLGSALELSLAVLDAAVDLDTGRTLATDTPQLILAAGEWAGSVFESESKGRVAAGGGGAREGRLRATAAGVVVKIAEIGDKWGRAM